MAGLILLWVLRFSSTRLAPAMITGCLHGGSTAEVSNRSDRILSFNDFDALPDRHVAPSLVGAAGPIDVQ